MQEKLEKLRPVWAEIDLDLIAENIKTIIDFIQADVKLLAVVKGDGYGHGAVEVAETVIENGADWLGVAILEEAVELREAGIKAPILTFSPLYESQINDFIDYDITPIITRVEMAEKISQAGEKLNQVINIHLILDTGMGRLGFLPSEAVEKVKEINSLSNIKIEGICSHLPNAYDEGEEAKNYTERQIELFKELVAEIEAEGIEIPIKHLANSSGLMEYPESQLDMVRSGIINYGLWPCVKSKIKRLKKELGLDFKAALELKAKIAYIKTLPAGYGISYGGEYVTEEPTRIGIVPLGWGDGYPRFLTGVGKVKVNGRECNILGVICMDQLMIDLRDIEAEAGSEVLIVGREELTAYDVAVQIGSINYELVTRIGPRVPRVYLKNGEISRIEVGRRIEY